MKDYNRVLIRLDNDIQKMDNTIRDLKEFSSVLKGIGIRVEEKELDC
ncbi:MAG: hypothetical protein KKH98_13820 [Spirochaetes bacterium]|nr:hypothetical protein [Spirochaetota bacterium]